MVTGRFAPTPSGYMHLGNLFCAMTAYLSARSQGGRFLLRIEDVDTPRCRREYTNSIIDVLTAFGFSWDEDIIYQSSRSEIYCTAMNSIKSHTYPCFCSRAELLQVAAPNEGDTQRVYNRTCFNLTANEVMEKTAMFAKLGRTPSVRLHVPDKAISFNDRIFGNVEENLASECGDFILRRSDGIWGYQLACVVDDYLSGVNEIVRGRDILSATPRQIYLRQLITGNDIDNVWYAHIPLLKDNTGKRLAKRDSCISIEKLLKNHSPEEILGMLAYSANIIPENRPSSLEELTEVFNWKNIQQQDILVKEI